MGVATATAAAATAAAATAAAADPWSALTHTSFQHHPVTAGSVFAQDRNGFVWLGTQSGLVRWDGYRMRRYVANPADSASLRDSYVLSLHVDAGGQLWIGTSSGGLVRYQADSDNFVTYPAGPGGVSHVSVSALADDGQGGVWIGTGAGLDHLSASGKLTKGSRPNGLVAVDNLPEGGISALLLDRKGTLWIGTRKGLLRLVKGGKALEPVALNIAATVAVSVIKLFQDSAGRIWVGTRNNGALVINEADGAVRPVLESGAQSALQSQRVFAIVQVSADEIWLGTEGAGIVAVNPATGVTRRIRRRLGSPDSLYDDDIHGLFRERGGMVFVGTPDAMSLYDPHASAIQTIRDAGFNAVGNMSLQSILVRPDGRLWLGVAGGGIDIVDPVAGAVAQLVPGKPRAETSLPTGRVLTMANGPDGTVYMGTQQGLYRSAGGHVERLSIAERAPGVPVWAAVFQGKDLWFGGLDGIWKVGLEPGKPPRLLRHESASLGDIRVTSMLSAADGSMWVGTKAGLARIDGATGKVVRMTSDAKTPGALAPGFVSSMLIDRKGRLWLSIFGVGVAVLERTDAQGQPHFVQLGVANGLPHAGVNALREDALGYIWASTDDGLARIDPATYAIRALGWAEGVKIPSYWTNSSATGPRGELLFGGASGLTIVRPERFSAWNYQAPMVVTAVSVNDVSMPVAPFNQTGSAAKRGVIRITPQARERGFAVEFSALDYSAPERNRYAYRLLGFDKDWISTDANQRRVSYNNLPPGEYTLQLRGSNRDGMWSPPLELTVHADPLWHQRALVRVAGVLAFAALMAGLLQARTAYLRRRQRELQDMVNQRTAELQASQQMLEVMAYSDPLTGLPNRRCFTDELRHMGARAVRERNQFTLLLIDLDHFKQVNDTIGHDAGDALLVEAARRMKLAVREADRLARLGGDEFAILLSNTGNDDTLNLVCSRIVASMVEPVLFGPHTLRISASIGAATFDGSSDDLDQLYKNADLALYATKGKGRNGWTLYMRAPEAADIAS